MMKFWKMNGAGNDFIILDNRTVHLTPEQLSTLAKTVCHRHMSIGADGIMVVDESHAGADFRMTYLNSDGSLGEMCGNGARCICRYGYENGLSGEVQTVETTSGIVKGWRIDSRLYRIRLNDPTVIELDHPLEVDGSLYPCSYVELGTPGLPHAAVPIANLALYDDRALFDLGRKMRFHPSFPKGANVNFYEITGTDELFERTYERGVEDFTFACGTGTGSVVTALTLQGKVSGKDVLVKVAGGELKVTVAHDGQTVNDLFLTGPTNIVAKGEIFDEDLHL